MQFLVPIFLIAFVSLAIPIIIHLFHFRRFKRVYFTNVRFLKEVKEETSSRSRLRNLLVLLMRLLALTFLVLAFAQPFFSRNDEVQQGNKAVSIFIDNSFSMEALSQDVPLLDQAKQKAREILQAYGEEDRFQILTMALEGRHQRLVSQEEALALIDEVEISPEVQLLSNVLTRQKQVLEGSSEENRIAYLVSDFQRSIMDIENYQDTTVTVFLVPLQSVQERNISIDSAWFEAPVQMVNQTNRLVVQIRNLSNEDAENIRLSIKYEGQTKPVGTSSVPAQSFVRDTVNISIARTGWHEAELAITDFPVQFDDKYFFSFYVTEEVKVLSINNGLPNRYLNAALSGLEYFSITNQSSQQLDYSRFSEFQLIILNDLPDISTGLGFELKQYVENGGNLLVFPARDAVLGSYRAFLESFPANEPEQFEGTPRVVGEVNTSDFIFQDVFENRSANLKLPVTQGNYRFSRISNRLEQRLLTYRDGSAFLSRYKVGEGNLYVCAAPVDDKWNDLVQNGEIFVPMLFKIAISGGSNRPIAYTIGSNPVLEARHQANSTELVYKMRGTSKEFIPEQRVVGAKVFLSTGDQVEEAGFYKLFLKEGEELEEYAFNYNRKESELSYFNPADLKTFVGDLAQVIDTRTERVLTAGIEERSQGIVLWRWCIIFALIFLAVEVLLLRLWKV